MCGCGGTSAPRPGPSSSGPMRSAKMNGPTIRRAWKGNRRSTSDAPMLRRRGAMTRSIVTTRAVRLIHPSCPPARGLLAVAPCRRLVSEPYIIPKGLQLPDHQSPSGPSPVSVVVGAGLPRASGADAARTLVDAVALGTLSTLALDPPGHPFGSIVSFATDAGGSPLFVISELAEHTRNLLPGSTRRRRSSPTPRPSAPRSRRTRPPVKPSAASPSCRPPSSSPATRRRSPTT